MRNPKIVERFVDIRVEVKERRLSGEWTLSSLSPSELIDREPFR